jgi:hypothetical protein
MSSQWIAKITPALIGETTDSIWISVHRTLALPGPRVSSPLHGFRSFTAFARRKNQSF